MYARYYSIEYSTNNHNLVDVDCLGVLNDSLFTVAQILFSHVGIGWKFQKTRCAPTASLWPAVHGTCLAY